MDSIVDCARRFMAHPQVQGRRVYGQVGFNFAAHARGIAFDAGEWPLLTLTVPREEFVFEKEMSPFIRTPLRDVDVCASG